jgi:hypothetical protein
LSDAQAQAYAEQIESCRRFRAICAQILEISQAMADLATRKSEGKKNSRN